MPFFGGKLRLRGRFIAAYMEWKDIFSVNVKEFDEQHKKLIEMINELHDAIKKGQGRVAIAAVMEGMIDYALTHFANEERYMYLFHFPGYNEHKLEHDAFVDKVVDFQKMMGHEENPAFSLEIMEFLENWLVKHIQVIDRRYGPFLNTKGIR